MGIFGRKRAEPVGDPADAIDVGDSSESQQFAQAARRGDLQRASDLLDEYLASGSDEGSADESLLGRAATTRRALLKGRLDDAAAVLTSWEVPYPNRIGAMLEPGQLGRLNTLGLGLIEFFEHPESITHSQYDELMDGKLASVAKSTRLGMPGSGQSFFDTVYASIKSQPELSRGR